MATTTISMTVTVLTRCPFRMSVSAIDWKKCTAETWDKSTKWPLKSSIQQQCSGAEIKQINLFSRQFVWHFSSHPPINIIIIINPIPCLCRCCPYATYNNKTWHNDISTSSQTLHRLLLKIYNLKTGTTTKQTTRWAESASGEIGQKTSAEERLLRGRSIIWWSKLQWVMLLLLYREWWGG